MIIARRAIGRDMPPYIVAELGAAHNGSFERAVRLIEEAKAAGADAVKLQCFEPAKIAAARGGWNKQIFTGPWAGWTLGPLYHKAMTPKEWFPALFEVGRDLAIPVFASVFDREGIDFLEALDCPAYKVASFELGDLQLIDKAAATGKPLILSTGMATNHDVGEAVVAAMAPSGSQPPALLHCVSAYPCPVACANVGRIEELRYLFQLPVGYSDHTLGSEAAIVATALGASIIEKHITLSRQDGGLDDHFATEPDEFKAFVAAVKNAHAALQETVSEGEAAHRDLRVKVSA
jgi:sialic acid synthase SpsE